MLIKNSTQPNNTYRAYVGLQFQQPDYVGLHRLRSLCSYHITYIVIRFFVMLNLELVPFEPGHQANVVLAHQSLG